MAFPNRASVLGLLATAALASGLAALPFAGAGGVPASIPTVGGEMQACKCCIEGAVDVCRACSGDSCTCDFDAMGLPRCTGYV
jgi:hypothetical protein